MMSGVAIETGLVVLLSLLPIVEKAIGRMTNLGEENAVLIFQSIIVAYIVKTCKLLSTSTWNLLSTGNITGSEVKIEIQLSESLVQWWIHFLLLLWTLVAWILKDCVNFVSSNFMHDRCISQKNQDCELPDAKIVIHSKADFVEHVLFYWAGPLVVSFALGFMPKSQDKQKTE